MVYYRNLLELSKGMYLTSVCIFIIDPTPFSVLILLELLFGELGPDPGALLHADSKIC